MADNFISQKNYDELVAARGPEAAAAFVRKYGLEVRPSEVEFTAVSDTNAGGESTMEDDDNTGLAVATEDAADNTGEEDTSLAVGGPKADEYTDWESQQNAFIKKAQKQRLKQFTDAKAYIEQNYRGPSLSEQLFAISQAFLSPTSMPGFKGTLANIVPAFNKIAQENRVAGQKRTEALLNLQKQYQDRELNAEGDILKNRLALIRARAAGGPKYDVNPKGGYQRRPGTGGAPPYPEMDNYGNYVITDIRQLDYLAPNTPVVEVGQDPKKPKYVPAR